MNIVSSLFRRIGRNVPFVFLFFNAGLVLVLFWSVLFGDRQFNYRDEAHFYHPLYHYIQTELSAGRFPLWTPYDNFGQPLFANAALGILYPGKLIFFLPFDYSLLFNWYIVAHVFLAAWMLYRLARHWGISSWGATLGAMAYGFGGGVFGQYSNPIFLVGAAWLPEAVLHIDRALIRRSIREALAAAVVLSVMLLGGDAQAAFHVGMAAVLLALFRRQRERNLQKTKRPSKNLSVARPLPERLLRNRGTILVLLAGATFLLSAIQILPSREFARLSDRSDRSAPRSVWEIVSYESGGAGNRPGMFDAILFRKGAVGGHQASSYEFSTHPAQFATFLWSSFGGHTYPRNTFWLPALVDILKPPYWLFTFYIGIVPFLLAIASMRLRPAGNAGVRTAWLSWLLLFSLGGAMGYYGLGWMAERLFGTAADRTAFGPPVGGVYWLFQTFVPGYVTFRYPAKLMTLAMFPLSMLAGFGWDRYVGSIFARQQEAARRMRIVRAGAIGIILFSLFLLAPSASERDWHAIASRIPANAVSGPFQPDLARSETIRSLAQTAGVLAAFLLLPRCLSRCRKRIGEPIVLFLILSATAFDLHQACRPTLILADRTMFQDEKSLLVETILEDLPVSTVPRRYLLHSAYHDEDTYPRSWRDETDPDRWDEALRWEKDRLFFCFHYDLGRAPSGILPLADVCEGETAMSRDYRDRLNAVLSDEKNLERHLALAGVRYVLTSSARTLDPRWATPLLRGDPESDPEGRLGANILWKIEPTGERSWIERSGEKAAGHSESCGVTDFGPNRVVLEAELAEPGTVVLAEQFWPGWRVDVESLDDGKTDDGTIRPVQSLFRGVDLPAGRFRLTYRYRPDSFRYGAVLSGIGWILLAASIFVPKRGVRFTRFKGSRSVRPAGATSEPGTEEGRRPRI